MLHYCVKARLDIVSTDSRELLDLRVAPGIEQTGQVELRLKSKLLSGIIFLVTERPALLWTGHYLRAEYADFVLKA